MAKWTLTAWILVLSFPLAKGCASPAHQNLDGVKIAKHDSMQWADNMSSALQRAKAEHKLVFVDIGSDW